jgi:ATP-binding cassette, subfamily F, member 2
MEAVLWLEDYLCNWDKILFFVCHSQDFMNNVCTHIVRLDMTYKKLKYYSGNYDTYVQTRRDQDMVQWRQYDAEQKDIAEIKEFIARFGHGKTFLASKMMTTRGNKALTRSFLCYLRYRKDGPSSSVS